MSKSKEIKKRIKPDLPGGFRDYGPVDAIAKQGMIDTIRRTFESFGFDPPETSSVQKTEVLTGGEEDSGKIIFNVKGSQEEISDTSLRFDLTVPLARFVADNPEIPKPFKRYQIGTVWRGERQQAGRYREFMQADVDIVDVASLDADAEIAAVIYDVFTKLPVRGFIIKYNSRNLLNILPRYAGFPEQNLWDALRIIDKADRIGVYEVRNELAKLFDQRIAEKIEKFIFGFPDDIQKSDTQSIITNEYIEVRKRLEALNIDCDRYFCLLYTSPSPRD